MREKDDLDRYYESFLEAIKKTDDDDSFSSYFHKIANSGTNQFYQKNIKETKHFDEEWISTLESYFPSIDKITKTPKSTIRYDEDVVAIEKAKKTTAASVRHLASHSELIRDVRGDEVIPKKILTSFAEEEYATYENRFLKTLINRLNIFVRNRYNIIKENVESFQKDHMVYISSLGVLDTFVTIKMDVEIKKDLDNKKINEHNYQLLHRAEQLLTLVSGLVGSPFMQMLSKAKDVRPPIMKTNVILKNPDFRNSYMLWLFLDKYNSLSFDVNINEHPIRLSKGFNLNLNRVGCILYSSMLNNMKNRSEDFENLDHEISYTKKSTKQLKSLPEDFVKNPDSIVFDKSPVNEYYLDQFRKTFSKKYKEYVEETNKSDLSLRRTIQDTLDISNNLYSAIFDFEDTGEDYFTRLVKKTNPRDKLDLARQKLKYAKMIREIKESDYKKIIRQEKALMNEIVKASNEIIRENNQMKKEDALSKLFVKFEKENKKCLAQKKKITAQIDMLNGKAVIVDTNKTLLKEEIDKINEKAKLEEIALKQKAKEELKETLKSLRIKHKEEQIALQNKLEADLRIAKEKHEKKLADASQAAKEKIKLLKQKEKEKMKATCDREKLNQAKSLKEIKEKYKAKINEKTTNS